MSTKQAYSGLKHIVLTGPRNAGKSSLLNNLFKRDIAIVSEKAGTTTDPVTRKIEIPGLGAMAVSDTAGIDDVGELGRKRIEKTDALIADADIVLFVTPAHLPPLETELKYLEGVPAEKLQLVFSFSDRDVHPEKSRLRDKYAIHEIDNTTGSGIDPLFLRLEQLKDRLVPETTPLEGLISEGDLVLLVTPIDLAAPKGRLIMPQTETIRDALDRDCAVLVTKERELHSFYNALNVRPRLVVTDSQAFHSAAADIPPDQPLTSFSILFARKKGDLVQFAEGVRSLKQLTRESKILVLEACSHHRQADDIGTVKIPRLARQLISKDLVFEYSRELPKDNELGNYDMIIHCGGCMITRNKMQNRLDACRVNNVPVVNYGFFLAWASGLLERAMQPFGINA